jgi:hypothetical protein
MKLVALALLSGIAAVSASCPNDCNGHGSCNVYSACDCYRNWMGADCSERVCYFGLAFVDTPAGDLNTDGLISGDSGYRTRMSNSDTHEIYPWYAGWGGTHYSVRSGAGAGAANGAMTVKTATSGGAGGEAHFYKECSNKGICNRASGQCECFPGFTGEGCTRTACPDDCSGHGTCTRMVDKAPSYRGWDLYATQECACDPGYFGPNCSLRKCPMGDDPVTKYEGFTRITLQDKATYGGSDGFGFYDRTKCAEGNRANSDRANFTNETAVNDNSGAYSSATLNVADPQMSGSNTSDWVYRIWSHDKLYTSDKYCASSPASNNNCYGWNPWYSQGLASGPKADIDNASADKFDACGWSGASGLNTAICQQNGISYRSAALKGTSAVSATPMTVYGTESHASGTMTGGGCASTVFDSATQTDCKELDFWSLYLKDVSGQFQVGDTLRIDGYASAVVGADRTFGFELCNYIKEVGTYYASASNKLQKDEEQLLVIDYTNVTADTSCANGGACTNLEGYFSLEFTDEMGDTWMTEAIQVRSSKRTTLNGESYDFIAADAVDGYGAGAAATGHALAVQIQNALEALPNTVVPNVQVEYRPSYAKVLDLRYYTISFLENTGNLPELKVAYSFTDTVGSNKVMASNAECESTGGSGATSSTSKCLPYFGRATAVQRGFATGAISSTEGAATATIFNHSRAPSAGIGGNGVGLVSYGADGTKENVECSNRGVCDYASGLCQCFTGFTNRDCSIQNSLAAA